MTLCSVNVFSGKTVIDRVFFENGCKIEIVITDLPLEFQFSEKVVVL